MQPSEGAAQEVSAEVTGRQENPVEQQHKGLRMPNIERLTKELDAAREKELQAIHALSQAADADVRDDKVLNQLVDNLNQTHAIKMVAAEALTKAITRHTS